MQGDYVFDSAVSLPYSTGWFAIQLEGVPMQQINLYEFYQLGANLDPATRLRADKPRREHFFVLFFLRIWLERIIEDTVIPLTICKPAARKVLRTIKTLIPLPSTADLERDLTEHDLYLITQGTREFATIFAAEVQNLATYFVSKKGIYDTNALIQRADELFSEPIRQHLSEGVKLDVKEVGKCLAFDLSTAAGFHIARAVEGVLLDYLRVLCPKETETLKESQRNLGYYIKLAREQKGDDKVCNSLDQFRDLHRNPLIHPETVLSMDEALTLLGIAQSAMVSMVMDIEKRNPVPSIAPG